MAPTHTHTDCYPTNNVKISVRVGATARCGLEWGRILRLGLGLCYLLFELFWRKSEEFFKTAGCYDVCVCVCELVFMHALAESMCVCLYVCTCLCVRVSICVCLIVCVCVCVYVCMCVCVCVCVLSMS